MSRSGATTPREAQATRSGAGPSDAALVVAARAGEAWAQEALFRRHGRRINGLAFRVLGRDEDVDDLVQDAFIAAFTGLSRLDDPAAFGGWLSSILVRQAHKKIRTRRLLVRLGLRSASPPIDVDDLATRSAPIEIQAELRSLYRFIDAMSADLRVPLILHRVEGMTLDEIASALAISTATVKRRIAAADAELRRHGGGAT